MPGEIQSEIIELHTLFFAENICRAINDMAGISYAPEKRTFKATPFSTSYKMIVYISFSGTVQGEYLVALDENVAARLLGIESSGESLQQPDDVRNEAADFVKEILNISANISIHPLSERYGELTATSATVVYGQIEFPDIISGSVSIEGKPGSIQCSFSLNLAKLKIGEKLTKTMEELKELTELLEDQVEKRTNQLKMSNEKLKKAMDLLWGEMQLAKKIQTVLLPDDIHVPGYDISGCLYPADDIGGDYYDVIFSKGNYWMIIGDVSGHGVPAGLVMMMAQTAIHTVLSVDSGISPSKLIEIVNIVLTNNIRKLGEIKYMTITALARIENGSFLYSGLHQDIFIYRASLGNVECVETKGMWMGLIPEIDDMLWVDRLELHQGDVMMLFTDGITEAVDENGTMFGEKRLSEILKRNGHLPSEDIRSRIMAELFHFKKSDDITLLIVKRLC